LEYILGGDLLIIFEIAEIIDLIDCIMQHFSKKKEEGGIKIIGGNGMQKRNESHEDELQ